MKIQIPRASLNTFLYSDSSYDMTLKKVRQLIPIQSLCCRINSLIQYISDYSHFQDVNLISFVKMSRCPILMITVKKINRSQNAISNSVLKIFSFSLILWSVYKTHPCYKLSLMPSLHLQSLYSWMLHGAAVVIIRKRDS